MLENKGIQNMDMPGTARITLTGVNNRRMRRLKPFNHHYSYFHNLTVSVEGGTRYSMLSRLQGSFCAGKETNLVRYSGDQTFERFRPGAMKVFVSDALRPTKGIPHLTLPSSIEAMSQIAQMLDELPASGTRSVAPRHALQEY